MWRNFTWLIISIILTALLTAWITTQWMSPQKIIVKETLAPTLTDYKVQSQLSGAGALKTQRTPTNFVVAATASRPAVVYVRARQSEQYDPWNDSYGSSTGSGVIISPDGYIVTNNHVVEEGSDIEVMLNDRREFAAQLLGTDPTTDLALLKIDADDLPFLTFGNSDSLQVGEWVLAVGNPFRLQSTVTAGIVSAKGRNINILDMQYGIESFIQTDAAVNPGNSGGALVNTKGELVGINTAIITFTGRYEGYSFAIPSNLARKVVRDLREFGAVHRGLLGVEAYDVDAKLAERIGMDEVKGVYIEKITAGSGADESDLQVGDILLQINGTPTHSMPKLLEQLGRYRPGDQVVVTYLRNGDLQTADVTLKNQLNTTDLVNIRRDELLVELGFEVRDLIASEQRSLDVEGVKVISIYRGSTIDRTKMEPGFVITKVNDRKVNNTAEFIDSIEGAEGRIILEGIYPELQGPWWYAFEK